MNIYRKLSKITVLFLAMVFFFTFTACKDEGGGSTAVSEKKILIFDFESPAATGVVNEDAKTVTLTVPHGTAVDALAPTITVSADATVSPESGVAQNFSSPVTYTVTGKDGSTQEYVVTVIVAKSSEKKITEFKFESPSASGNVKEDEKTVSVGVPHGTAVDALTPTITVSEGATVSPESGVAQDFNSPVTYIVTAEDGTSATYTVTVTVSASDSKKLTGFSFSGISLTGDNVEGTVNEETKTVEVEVPFGTNVTALVATFSYEGSNVKVDGVDQTSGTTQNNFTNPVTYTVIASDNSTENYIVTVTEASALPISKKAITGLTVPVVGGTPVTKTDLGGGGDEWQVESLSWSPAVSGTFAYFTEYTATVTLSAKLGYSFSGLAANSFTVSGATVTHPAGSDTILTVTAVFPTTAPAVVTKTAITGLAVPVVGGTPAMKTDLGGGGDEWQVESLSWSPESGTFAYFTEYTATVTLSAKLGYSFSGLEVDSFTVAGATVTHPAGNSTTLTVTAVFPKTAGEPITAGAIEGLTAPVVGKSMDNTVNNGTQWTAGLVFWNPGTFGFQGEITYSAEILLTANTGFTFNDFTGSFTVDGATTVTTSNNTGDKIKVTATFPKTAPALVGIQYHCIEGLDKPFPGGSPDLTVNDCTQWTASTVSWSPAVSGTFAYYTEYTATVTLSAKFGYTFDGLTANKFTVSEASSVTHPAGDSKSLTVTIVFPKTGIEIEGLTVPVLDAEPDTDVINGTQWTAGIVTWSPTDSPFKSGQVYVATIPLIANTDFSFTGATEDCFIVDGATSITTSDNTGDTINVIATFPATSDIVVDTKAIPGVTVPVKRAMPVTTITETDQYIGSVTWKVGETPFVGDKFVKNVVYTAVISLTPKNGYTFNGVTENFFTVAGADSVTNVADSGVVTVTFPATETIYVSFDDATTPGQSASITVGSEAVDFIYTNNQTSITFPFSPSPNTPVNDGTATLTRKFFMSETEVTNALMVEVLQWAYNNGKFSTIVTDHNGLDSTTVKYGGKELLHLDGSYIKITYSGDSFTVVSGYENYPVRYVTWYGAIMFCNWLTEMIDGDDINVVYSGIDTDWDHLNTVEDPNKTGYRLPLNEEWEYAARYLGTTEPTEGNLSTEYVAKDYNDGRADLTEGYYWTPCDYVSGAVENFWNEAVSRDVAWFRNDPDMGDVSKLMPVEQKRANWLGIYDMSGNITEWCFSLLDYARVLRVGHYADASEYLSVGYWGYETIIDRESSTTGFRLAKTQ